MKKATSKITQKIDKIAQDLQQEVSQENMIEQPKEKIYYSSVAYLQSSDDTTQFEELKDKQDYDGILKLAKEYYDGNGINEQYTYTSPTQNKGDSVLVEDKDFIVVYNSTVGGTFDIMLKFNEQEIRDHINRYGVDNTGDTMKEVAKDMTAEQFSAIAQEKIPAFEMPNGDVLYVNYNRDSDTIDVGSVTNAGFAAMHNFSYDHNASLDSNLQDVHEKLREMEEYQTEENEYSGGMRR